MTKKTANRFQQRAEEPGIGGTMMSLPKLQHDGIEVLHVYLARLRAEESKVGGTM